MLLWTLERFQDRIWVLAHEESSMGRFLREAGKVDKTRAGTMLAASGKTMSFIANQRILLRNPLVRLYQDIETFQYRAVTDTYETIDKMETARTGYRAALLWMKDISSKLDPDTYKQLEKFRKVQSHVRRCKARFEKIKIDTYQKIDMLSASRVNMLSHSLGLYQKEWLSFYEKSSKIMNEVDQAFAGYQYYDFNILKQLAEPQRKAIHAGGMINSDLEKKLNSILEGEPLEKKSELESTSAGEDKLLFFEPGNSKLDGDPKKNEPVSDLLGLDQPAMLQEALLSGKPNSTTKKLNNTRKMEMGKTFRKESEEPSKSSTLDDLLTAAEPDEREILNEIFAGPVIEITSKSDSGKSFFDVLSQFQPSNSSSSHCLPSEQPGKSLPKPHIPEDLLSGDTDTDDLFQKLQSLKSPSNSDHQAKTKQENTTDKWLNLFAELDPLANPDAIGENSAIADQDRTC